MNNKRLRILFNSNAPWAHSGYAQQTKDLVPTIFKDGYPIAYSNFYGQAGGKFVDKDGIMNYPIVDHVYGSDALLYHGKDFNADIGITLQDTWILNPVDLQQISRWVPWVPVDHDPIPIGVTRNMRFAYRIIAMSKFGQKQLANVGFASTYIPHHVDTKVFFPMNRQERKQIVGIKPDTYVIGMVSANKDNPPRKSFQQVLDAYKLFLEKVPNSLLYIHTNPKFPGGFPIDDYAAFLGIQGRVVFPEKYKMNFNTPKEEMNLVYNTFDVLLCPSVSEGFGIPIIEAQACGVPVIVNNFTSMPELIQPGITGEICDVATKVWAHQQSYLAIPNYQSLYEKMLAVYRYDRDKAGKAARKWIENEFALTKIYEQKWSPFLQKMETEIYGNIPIVDNPQRLPLQ